MLHDIDQYCRECEVCQSSKPPSPQKVPLISMSIGKPRQMVAVDILEVPVSFNKNRYLLVIQDYFSKWADAIPIPNQTADQITKELVCFPSEMVYVAGPFTVLYFPISLPLRI